MTETIVPKSQFDGVAQYICNPQIERFVPRSAILFLFCLLRRPERVAYRKPDAVLLRDPEVTLRLSAKFDV